MVNWEEKTAMELKTGSHNGLPLVSSPTRSLSGKWPPSLLDEGTDSWDSCFYWVIGTSGKPFI